MNQTAKRAMAFIDGQNLYRHAMTAFGHKTANYDVLKLFNEICSDHMWENVGINFYTGIPRKEKMPRLYRFWMNRFVAMGRQGINTVYRFLSYAEIDGVEVGREKGIDIRLALDLIRLTRENKFDVAVIFSQDQDLAEVVTEAKVIAGQRSGIMEIYSAFPSGSGASAKHGITGTKAIRIDEELYNYCLDEKNYFPG